MLLLLLLQDLLSKQKQQQQQQELLHPDLILHLQVDLLPKPQPQLYIQVLEDQRIQITIQMEV